MLIYLCKVKRLIRLKSKSHLRRRNIVIEEINILRNFELNDLIQNKITRELTKLHFLWFKGSKRTINNIDL